MTRFSMWSEPRLARIVLVIFMALAGLALPGLVRVWAQHADAPKATETAAVGAASHEGAGAESGGAESSEEALNLITLVRHFAGDRPWVAFLLRFENTFFAWLAVLILGLLAGAAFRRRAHQPGRLLALVEMGVEGLDNMMRGLLGKNGRQYTPFLGTLFLFIWTMNLMGLVPFLKAPTTSINTTAALALTTFVYVQYTGIRKLGIGGYLYHLAGTPRDKVTWALVPFMMPLHLITELARPLTLALRLFGNISGEDILVGAFVALGTAMLSFTHLPIGVPLQVPFIFLGMFFSTIQALVFTMLSAVYLLMMQPHDHEEGEAH